MKSSIALIALTILLLFSSIESKSLRKKCTQVKDQNILVTQREFYLYDNVKRIDGTVTEHAYDFYNNYAKVLKEMEIGDNDYTFSFYVKFDSYQTWQRIIDWNSGAPNNNIIISQRGTTTDLSVQVYNGGHGLMRAELPNGIRLGQWDHYVITIQNDLQVFIWRNGEDISSQRTYENRDAGATFPKHIRNNNLIGASPWSGDKKLDGQIDEFILFQGTLTEAEIKCLADKCTGTCEECQGDADTCVKEQVIVPFSGRSQCDVSSADIFDSTDSASVNLNGAVYGNGIKTQSTLSFDGVSYADFGSQTPFGGDLTVSFWLKPDNFENNQVFVDFSNGEESDSIIIGQYKTTNDLYVQVYDQSTEILNVRVPYVLEKNKWNHYAITFGSTNLEIKVYKNLVEQQRIREINRDSNATQIPSVARTQNYIGKSSASSGSVLFEGEIDELFVNSTIQTTAQLRCLYDLCDNTEPNCNKCANDANTCGGCIFTRELPSCSCPSNTLELGQPECKPFIATQSVSQLYCAPPRVQYNDGTNDYCVCSGDDSTCSNGQTYNFNTCQCE